MIWYLLSIESLILLLHEMDLNEIYIRSNNKIFKNGLWKDSHIPTPPCVSSLIIFLITPNPPSTKSHNACGWGREN